MRSVLERRKEPLGLLCLVERAGGARQARDEAEAPAVGLETHGRPGMLARALGIAETVERDREVVVRDGVARIELERTAVLGRGLGVAICAAQLDPAVHRVGGALGRGRERPDALGRKVREVLDAVAAPGAP